MDIMEQGPYKYVNGPVLMMLHYVALMGHKVPEGWVVIILL